MPTELQRRDLRIDFFKGVALLIVLVDHIEGWVGRSVIENWTPINLGFSDAAEIFIFTSGYVFAVAYSRTLASQGFGGCLKKALKRASQIYIAYLLASLTIIAIGWAMLEFLPPLYHDRFGIGEFPFSSIVAALVLCFHPWGFDILAMYVLILPWMAVLLYLLRGGTAAAASAWLISGSLYLVVQFEPSLNLPRFGDGGVWYFNPLAWQFLFFLGLVVGKPGRPWPAIAWRWPLVVLAVMVLVAGVVALKGFTHLLHRGVLEEGGPVVQFIRTWMEKTSLRPLRLVHFFALAYLTAVVVPRDWRGWSKPWARPIINAGQHSLEVYAFGLVLSFLAVFLLQRAIGLSAANIVLVDLAACALSLAFAYLVRWWKDRKPRAHQSPGDRRIAPPSQGPTVAKRVDQRRRSRRAS